MKQHFLNVQNSYAHSRVHIALRKGLEQILPQYFWQTDSGMVVCERSQKQGVHCLCKI